LSRWPDNRRAAGLDRVIKPRLQLSFLEFVSHAATARGRHAKHRPPEVGTLVLAVVRGLIMDIEATGDAPRADRAFDDFLAALTTVTTRRSRVILAGSGADTPSACENDRPDTGMV
jgi:hypothetical protein